VTLDRLLPTAKPAFVQKFDYGSQAVMFLLMKDGGTI
jgi:hypothetical protein